jgi:hypothetical protein
MKVSYFSLTKNYLLLNNSLTLTHPTGVTQLNCDLRKILQPLTYKA